MRWPLKRLGFFMPLLALISACASLSPQPPPSPISGIKAYTISDSPSLISRYAPFLIIERPRYEFNRVGTPRARMVEDGTVEVFVDPALATIYTETRRFQTDQGLYTNLLYRIHFEKVPLGFVPFYIGMGKNVGLFIIVTLNSDNEPVLYTTVHSCGCYLAFIPTSYLPDDAFPRGWVKGRQTVFGEVLPGYLDYQGRSLSETQLMLLVRSGSHRVKGVWLAGRDSLGKYDSIVAKTLAITALARLPLANQTTSFYEISGPRKDYVKGSHKPWERMLMSWWALDWRIGEDKRLGRGKDDGPVFYTSLKPWARQSSDMRDFAAFLSYWGWAL